MFENLCLCGMMVFLRPRRCVTLWAYLLCITTCDLYFASALLVPHGDLATVWDYWFYASLLLEALFYADLTFKQEDSLVLRITGGLVIAHISLQLLEVLAWETFTGKYAYRFDLNRAGWDMFAIRQYCKIALAPALAAFILKMRTRAQEHILPHEDDKPKHPHTPHCPEEPVDPEVPTTNAEPPDDPADPPPPNNGGHRG